MFSGCYMSSEEIEQANCACKDNGGVRGIYKTMWSDIDVRCNDKSYITESPCFEATKKDK